MLSQSDKPFSRYRIHKQYPTGYNVNLPTAVAAILFFVEGPQINSVRGLTGIKVKSRCEVNQTSGFQDIAFTSNILHRVQC